MTGQLHERTAEVAQFQGALADARAGAGQLVLIEAAAGTGKSSLVDAAHQAAVEQGDQVLRARGGELERDYAFGAVRQLFEPLVELAPAAERARRLHGRAALAARIFDGAAPGSPADETPQDAFAVARGLHGLIVNVSAERPLLLTVDDAHWVDGASLRWLDFLARRITALPVTVVVAFRPGEPGADAAGLDLLRSHPGAVSLRPAPLSARAVAALVHDRLPGASTAQVDAYVHASGGNPFYLRELLRLGALGADELRGAALPDLGDRVTRRIAKVSPDAPTLAAAIAILGDGAPLAHAATLSELAPEHAATIARQLRQIEILATDDPAGFVHPVVRQSVDDALSSTQRAAFRRSAAEVLRASGAPIESIAVHLALLPPSGSEDIATQLLAAGRDAVSRAAPAAAVGRFQRALDEHADRPHRAEILVELGQTQAALRDLAAIASLRSACELATSPELLVRAAVILGEFLAAAGNWREAVDLTESVKAKVDASNEELRAELDALRSVVIANDSTLMREYDRDLPALERVAAGPSWPARALSSMIGSTASARGAEREDVMPYLEHAMAGGVLLSRGATGWAGAQVLGTLIELEDYTRAAAYAEEVEEVGRRSGVMVGIVTGSGFGALADLRRGRVAAAEARLRQLLDMSIEAEMPMWVISLCTLASDALIERPALADAVAMADAIQIEERFAASASGAMLREARGRLALARGDRVRAATELRASSAVYDAMGWGPPRTMWRSDLALAVLSEDPDEALDLARTDLRLARRAGNRRAEGIALRACGLATGGDDGLALLQASVAGLQRTEARLDYARSRVELGAALRRAGRRAEGRAQLTAGVELAEQCGALHLLARAEEELRAAGARPRRRAASGVSSLTASEARVVRLAAAGRTNLEIAQDLYVGLKTVETHLSRAYAKLGLAGQGSRRRLAELLADFT